MYFATGTLSACLERLARIGGRCLGLDDWWREPETATGQETQWRVPPQGLEGSRTGGAKDVRTDVQPARSDVLFFHRGLWDAEQERGVYG